MPAVPGRVLICTVVAAIAEEAAPRCCALVAAGCVSFSDRAHRPGQTRGRCAAELGSRCNSPQSTPEALGFI